MAVSYLSFSLIISLFCVEPGHLYIPLFNFSGCGLQSVVRPRMEWGHTVKIQEMPWMAAILEYKESQFELLCSAFIISSVHAVTAAHCLLERDTPPDYPLKPDIYVGVGSAFWKKLTPHRVAHVWITQETRPTIRNKPPLRDIAVLSVTQPFALNDTVRPICIVDSFPTIRLPKDTFLIAGFGKRTNKKRSKRLIATKTRLLGLQNCKPTPEHRQIIRKQEFCTENLFYRPCPGDEGGPLMLEERGVFYAVAVLTQPPTCRTKLFRKSVYTRLDSMLGLLVPLLRQSVQTS